MARGTQRRTEMYETEPEKIQTHGITCKIPWVVLPPSNRQEVKRYRRTKQVMIVTILWLLLLGAGTTQIPLNIA